MLVFQVHDVASCSGVTVGPNGGATVLGVELVARGELLGVPLRARVFSGAVDGAVVESAHSRQQGGWNAHLREAHVGLVGPRGRGGTPVILCRLFLKLGRRGVAGCDARGGRRCHGRAGMGGMGRWARQGCGGPVPLRGVAHFAALRRDCAGPAWGFPQQMMLQMPFKRMDDRLCERQARRGCR